MENNIIIYEEDKKDYDLKILPDIKSGKLLTVFCSFTYITPNYSILFTLEKLKELADSGNYKILIILWDMNTLANPYFKKLASSKKIKDISSFIDQKVEEVQGIATSMGFNKDKFSVYKSSDLWKRLISYKEDDLFQQFYSMLAQMKTKSFSVSGDKISHFIQIPMDIMFCNYFHKLYPEDLNRPVDLAFFGENKQDLYLATRGLMIKNGIMENKNPIFILIKNIPYIIYNESIPEWNMGYRDIKDIIIGCNLPKKDIFTLFKHIDDNTGSIQLEDGKEEMEYEDFYKKYKNKETNELSGLLAESIYSYLQDRKKKYMEASGQMEEKILTVSNKTDLGLIGSILKSKIALEIVLKADGTRTLKEISKEIDKSPATISTYVSELKKMNVVRLVDKKLKRNIKGFKINLELGI